MVESSARSNNIWVVEIVLFEESKKINAMSAKFVDIILLSTKVDNNIQYDKNFSYMNKLTSVFASITI